VAIVEYAIWWDWDINHLYELEHIWTYVDSNGTVVHAEGSWHGNFRSLRRWQDRRLRLHDDTHPIAYSQPGKHAFAPTEEPFLMIREHVGRKCSAQAEKGGLWITPVCRELIAHYKTPEVDRLVNAYLKTQAFEPAFAWEQTFDVASDILIPWPALEDWIPQRVKWLLTWLRAESSETDRVDHGSQDTVVRRKWSLDRREVASQLQPSQAETQDRPASERR
jgi:putative hydrolase of the HAD superfamily